MSAPITKVVKNDAYTAPRPAVPVASPRPTTSLAATRSSAAALQPVSRTLQQSTAETSATAPPPPPQVNPFIFICSSVCVLSNCAHITCVIVVFMQQVRQVSNITTASCPRQRKIIDFL